MPFVIFIFFLLSASSAWCSEISALVGPVYETGRSNEVFSWQLEYSEQIGRHLEASFIYLNEGHIMEHHRDGHALQLRGRSTLCNNRLTVAVGTGPYLYYDTIQPDAGRMEIDRHGVGLLSTLSASWHFDNDFMLQIRLNGVSTSNSIDTISALAGVGYRLDSNDKDHAEPDPTLASGFSRKNELTFFIGQTNVFNDGSSHSASAAIEYRRPLLRYLDWSASLIYEGESELIRRRGVATQLWGSKSFLEDDLSFALGVGPYLAIDSLGKNERGGRDTYILPIITMSTAYRFHPSWGVRVSWNRVVTDYDRDADLWLGGVSYLF